jgi:hypothetical protein
MIVENSSITVIRSEEWRTSELSRCSDAARWACSESCVRSTAS